MQSNETKNLAAAESRRGSVSHREAEPKLNMEKLRHLVNERDLTPSKDVQTNRILELVRTMSNQDETIKGCPEVAYVLTKLIKFTDERSATHAASQEYYKKMNAIFFWPGIALTSITSATSFIASYFPEHTTKFNVAMGIMASLSTLIVALSETYRYGSKAEQHGLASESYENLKTRLFFKSVQIHAASLTETKDDDTSLMSPCEMKAFFTSIEDQITEIARQCKDIIPSSIVQNYKDTRFDAMVESLARNLKTVITQDKFAKIVNKISAGESLTQKDYSMVNSIEKQAKYIRKKRIKEIV